MARRFLIAPDKFKGSLTASEAADAIAAGILRSEPDAILDLCPIADGGEGFMETLAATLKGDWITCPAVDALGRSIESRYFLARTSNERVAILEMSETAGLWRLSSAERDPLRATTRGVGMQLLHAAQHADASRIILGLGGSATNDGGCGMAAALGVAFLDGAGNAIDPIPANFLALQRIDMRSRLALPKVTGACDVDNPLLGPRGATAVFAGQKGADETDKLALEAALAHLVTVAEAENVARFPGAGAAGGLGFGLLRFADAERVSGFDLLADLTGLEQRLILADHVITGEGSIDHQSLSGKGPVGLARMARKLGKPVTGFCGATDEAARSSGVFDALHALADSGLPLEILLRDAKSLLTELSARTRF